MQKIVKLKKEHKQEVNLFGKDLSEKDHPLHNRCIIVKSFNRSDFPRPINHQKLIKSIKKYMFD